MAATVFSSFGLTSSRIALSTLLGIATVLLMVCSVKPELALLLYTDAGLLLRVLACARLQVLVYHCKVAGCIVGAV